MNKLIEKQEYNADYSERGVGAVPTRDGFSLLTFKRLIRSRHKIFLDICALLFVAGAGIFYACNKENSNKVDNSYLKTATGKVLNEDYINGLIEQTGINLYELVASPFFSEYVSQLDAFSAYFRKQIKNNIAYKADFNALLLAFSQVLLWDEEDIPPLLGEEGYLEYQETYHQFYTLAEHLSYMYFGNNFNHEIEFDGVTYHVALDKIISIGDNYDMFEQAMMTSFPQYIDLPEHLQDLIRTVVLIMYGTCEDERDAALRAENERFAAEYAKCRNKTKHSKCVHKAVAKHEGIVIDIINIFEDCLNGGGDD